MFSTGPIIQRFLIIILTSGAILLSAASCSIPLPGFQQNSNPAVLGMLKKDPSVREDGFGRINAVESFDGTINAQGLAGVPVRLIKQYDKDTLFIVTDTKGVFRTDNAGRTWERQYIIPIEPQQTEQNARNQEVQTLISRNDAFITSDIAFNPRSKESYYTSGSINKVGKIFATMDGGKSFKEVHSEISQNSNISFLAIDSISSRKVYGVVRGGALIRSLDAGSTWQKIYDFPETPIQFGFIPEFDNLFYAVFATQGLYVSRDDGSSWNKINLTKERSSINEQQGQEGVTENILNQETFGQYKKIVPITKDKNSWLLIADSQLWYTPNLEKPFTKLTLPLKDEQNPITDVKPDPIEGSQKLLISIGNKLFESQNRGGSWSTTDLLGLSTRSGTITQIQIDQTNPQIVYLSLGTAGSK